MSQPAFSNISGTATSSQIPSDVAYTDATQTFTHTNTFSNTLDIGANAFLTGSANYLSCENSNAITVEETNASSTGTTTNYLAKINSSGQAVVTATSDTQGAVGVVVAGAGTSGVSDIAQIGSAQCYFDGTATTGDYVQISSTTAGQCHDAGSSPPSSGQTVGRVVSGHSGSGNALILLSVGGGATGANTALSNLTTTSINASLVPLSSDAYSIGSSSYYWYDLYAYNLILNGSTNESVSVATATGTNPGGNLTASAGNANGNAQVGGTLVLQAGQSTQGWTGGDWAVGAPMVFYSTSAPYFQSSGSGLNSYLSFFSVQPIINNASTIVLGNSSNDNISFYIHDPATGHFIIQPTTSSTYESNTSVPMYVYGPGSTGTSANGGDIHIVGGAGVGSGVEGNVYLDGTQVYINSVAQGDVGIGTTSPTALLGVAGPIATAISSQSGTSYNIAATDSAVLLSGTSGTITATLPTASGIAGREYIIKRTGTGATSYTVNTTSSQTIDGSTTYALSAQYKFVHVKSDGSNWQIIGNN
jgi:hypothetical protein